jgi:hypothetical protein
MAGTYLVESLVDITERERAEEILLDSEDKYRKLNPAYFRQDWCSPLTSSAP